jgi:hypothetical protein
MKTRGETVHGDGLAQSYRTAIDAKLNSQAAENDEFLSFYYKGWAEEIEDPAVAESLRELSEVRSEGGLNTNPDYMLELVLKVHQLKVLETGDRSYPEEDLASTEAARRLIKEITAEDNGHFAFDARWRTIQTMIDKRYMNVKLGWLMLGGAVAERAGTEPAGVSVIDFGCSSNHGLKRLARENDFPFSEEEVGVLLPSGKAAPELTARLYEYLRMPFKLASGIGIDSVDPRALQQSLWVKANCYPSELWAPERLSRFEDLECEVAGVRFAQADCDSLPQLSECIDLDAPSDIVVLSTMLYQHRSNPDRLAKIMNNAKRFAKNFVVVIDSADTDEQSPVGLSFPEHFYSAERPFGYSLFVLDMHDQKAGFQRLLGYENGRCMKMVPNLGHEAVASAFAVG